jgi:hypothetical protein
MNVVEANLNSQIDCLRNENQSLKSKIHKLEVHNQSLEKSSKTKTQINVKSNNSKDNEKEEKFEVNTRKKCTKKPIIGI